MSEEKDNLNLPDFLGIGAQKSATSWLYKMLQFHPDIYMNEKKEIHFFDLPKNYINGLGWYSNHFLYADDRVKGEITPAYAILSAEAIAYIKKIMPEVKLIYLLRNPVERAWSQAIMDLVTVPNREFNQVSEEEFLNFFKGEGCWKRGNYIESLKNWWKYFDHEQLYIGYFDEVKNSPKELLNKILTFLDVDPSKLVSYAPVEQKVHVGKSLELSENLRDFLTEQYKESMEALYEELKDPIINEWLG